MHLERPTLLLILAEVIAVPHGLELGGWEDGCLVFLSFFFFVEKNSRHSCD